MTIVSHFWMLDCLTVSVEMRATVEPVDDAQLEEAKSTIQRLARKYLVRIVRYCFSFALEKGLRVVSPPTAQDSEVRGGDRWVGHCSSGRGGRWCGDM